MKRCSLLPSLLFAVCAIAGWSDFQSLAAEVDPPPPGVDIGGGSAAGPFPIGKSGVDKGLSRVTDLPIENRRAVGNPDDHLFVAVDAVGEVVVIPDNPLAPPDLSTQVAIFLSRATIAHPWVALLLAFIGSMRLWGKPASLALHRYVESTPSKADDEFVQRVERSVWWTGVLFLLDWVASIKVPARTATVTRTESSRGLGGTTLATAFIMSFAWFGTGCAGLQPGAEGFVVRSEQTISASFTATDSFLKWEEANRAALPDKVTEIADTLREDFPPAHDAALASIVAYKRDRTTFAKDEVSKWLVTLQKMSDQAEKARAEIAKP